MSEQIQNIIIYKKNNQIPSRKSCSYEKLE
jgi:hypothetical protein